MRDSIIHGILSGILFTIAGWLFYKFSNKKNNSPIKNKKNENVAMKIITETKGGNEILEKLANEGNVESQFNMGTLHFKNQEYGKAFSWFEKGANMGNTDCQYQLGNLYLQGLGINKNMQKAFHWYEKSAIQNHPQSQHNLGLFYLQEGDKIKALNWLEKAAKNGYEQSRLIIEDLKNH